MGPIRAISSRLHLALSFSVAGFEDAFMALQRGGHTGLGFALGPDGTGQYWQGIDFDHLDQHPELVKLISAVPGYKERSPSGNGIHAVWLGTTVSRYRLIRSARVVASSRLRLVENPPRSPSTSTCAAHFSASAFSLKVWEVSGPPLRRTLACQRSPRLEIVAI